MANLRAIGSFPISVTPNSMRYAIFRFQGEACRLFLPTKSDQQKPPVFEEFGWLTFDDVSKHLANQPAVNKDNGIFQNPRTSGAIRKSEIKTAIMGLPNV